jgi:hypothetical protein
MTKFERSGAGKPEAFSKGILKSGGNILRLGSISKDRHRWSAEIVVRNGRALGTLKCGGIVVRPFFNVRIDTTGRFVTDIGTGSGVNVAFHTGSNVIE